MLIISLCSDFNDELVLAPFRTTFLFGQIVRIKVTLDIPCKGFRSNFGQSKNQQVNNEIIFQLLPISGTDTSNLCPLLDNFSACHYCIYVIFKHINLS